MVAHIVNLCYNGLVVQMTANPTEDCTLHNAQTWAKPRTHRGSPLIAILVSLLALLHLAGAALAQDITETQGTDPLLDLLEDAKPETDHSITPPNLGLRVYVVVQGDTLSGIASTFDLAQETIIWANPALQANPGRLSIGQELWIPPIDGAVHTIKPGDNLIGIAHQYGVAVEDITSCYYNLALDPTRLKVGNQILVPGATRAVSQPQRTRYDATLPADAAAGTGDLIWPVTGLITQGYHTGHYAIDIGGWRDKPIVAADDGFVIRSCWDDSGYGFVIIIEHNNGMQTLYAHLNGFEVEAGQSVSQGDTIGFMGESGYATGVHLHFEVIVDDVRQNPLDYLP